MTTDGHTNSLLSDTIEVTVTTKKSDILVSDQVALVLQWMFYTVLCQAIVIFGIGTNIINIICFIKQGFDDPVNVSFLGLAISDIGCLVTLIWCNVCYTPAFRARALSFDPIEVCYLAGGIQHTAFTRITGWITAIITLERCLCITIPLKVKGIITSKRVLMIIVAIFFVSLSGITPAYLVNKLEMKFYPERNLTLVGLVYTGNHQQVNAVSYIINNVLIPFSSFIGVIACTVILVIKLEKKARWRKKSTTSEQSDNLSARNNKVAKMVLIISTLFIVCFIPVCIMFIVVTLEPEFFINGKYINLVSVLSGICIILESINSSGNIFIYYYMSSKYRLTFRKIFSSSCYRLTGTTN